MKNNIAEIKQKFKKYENLTVIFIERLRIWMRGETDEELKSGGKIVSSAGGVLLTGNSEVTKVPLGWPIL